MVFIENYECLMSVNHIDYVFVTLYAIIIAILVYIFLLTI